MRRDERDADAIGATRGGRQLRGRRIDQFSRTVDYIKFWKVVGVLLL